jgi:hypothetical protein
VQLVHAAMAFLVGQTPLCFLIRIQLKMADDSTNDRYIADYVYALPTIAFFLSVLGIFIIGHFISSQVLGYRRVKGPRAWQKLIAVVRYLSYRGFHIQVLRWNSATVGLLLLAATGAVYFFCMFLAVSHGTGKTCANSITRRHRTNTATVLLAERRLRWFATTGYSIGVDGACLYAICFVSYSCSPRCFSYL